MWSEKGWTLGKLHKSIRIFCAGFMAMLLLTGVIFPRIPVLAESSGEQKLTVSLFGAKEKVWESFRVDQGKSFSASVFVKENTGFCDAAITVSYDPNLLTYEKVYLSAELRRRVGPAIIQQNVDGSRASVTIQVSSGDLKATGADRFRGYDVTLSKGTKLLTVQFLGNQAVGNAARQDTSSEIQASVDSVSNESGTNMNWDTENDVQAVEKTSREVWIRGERSYGDISEDGRVNLVDAAYLLQYYNGVRELTNDQIRHGDVNGDGSVTLVDVLLIMRSYNNGQYTGWDPARIPR